MAEVIRSGPGPGEIAGFAGASGSAPDMAPAEPPAIAPAQRHPKPTVNQAWIGLAGLGLALLLIIAAQRLAPPAIAPHTQPTASSPAPTAPAPTASSAQPASIMAYAAPDGAVLGPIDGARAYHFVGRYGTEWAQVVIGEPEPVWVRRADLVLDSLDEEALARLVDLAATPTPAPPPPTAPPAAPQPGPAVGAPASCDPNDPPYQITREVPPYGRVVGLSCNSLDEAAANADAAAAELRATAEARRTSAPTSP